MEVEQELRWPKDKEIELGGHKIMVKGNTPVKIRPGGRGKDGVPNLSDSMKLQVLRHYVLHAPDPLIRDEGPTARSK